MDSPVLRHMLPETGEWVLASAKFSWLASCFFIFLHNKQKSHTYDVVQLGPFYLVKWTSSFLLKKVACHFQIFWRNFSFFPYETKALGNGKLALKWWLSLLLFWHCLVSIYANKCVGLYSKPPSFPSLSLSILPSLLLLTLSLSFSHIHSGAHSSSSCLFLRKKKT